MMFPLAFVLMFLGRVSTQGIPKVCIPSLGCIQGTTLPGYQSEKYEAFMGIPFAQPPVGNLRFANPKPAIPWEGVLNATKAREDCIQKLYLLPNPFIIGEEDCLYLNVYRPIKKDKKLLPVMVYIFGGGFFSGSSKPDIHGPEYFMDSKEVILVTIAYRVGALGFLSTGDENMPGNFGLKDQNLALKWVQKYIQAFGGNTNSVTIFGQSAGGVSVHLHMLSPLSTGLFHRAIVMSGSAAAPFAIPVPDPLEQSRKQAEFCNIRNATTLSTKKLTMALRQVNATDLVQSGDGFKYWHVDPMTVFRPVVEQPGCGAFMTENPRELLTTGRYTHVPWMTGLVPHEGGVRSLAIVANNNTRSEFNEQFDYLLEKLMEFPDNNNNDEKVQRLVDIYFGGVHELNDDNAQGLVDIVTDRGFVHPFYKSIQEYVQYADLKRNPVYLYKFNYRGSMSYSMAYTGTVTDYGVVHCDDLIYLFQSPALFGQEFNKTSMESKVIKEWVDTYVSFAKYGKPKGSELLSECNHEVLKSTDDDTFCDYNEIRNTPDGYILKINNKLDVSKVRLWDSILN